jgi:hypothetical protein
LQVDATVKKEKIEKLIEDQLVGLMDNGAFKTFINNNRLYFPDLDKNNPVSVWVGKRKFFIGENRISIGLGIWQVYIRATSCDVINILKSPELFQPLFGLHGEAIVNSQGDRDNFQARIYKRVPVLKDQDYILGFSHKRSGNIWFQFAKLIEDRNEFALRAHLKVVESANEAVILRELSLVYPLKWWVRFLFGAVRNIMKREMRYLSKAIKCLAEKGPPFNENRALDCHRLSR